MRSFITLNLHYWVSVLVIGFIVTLYGVPFAGLLVLCLGLGAVYEIGRHSGRIETALREDGLLD